MTHRRASATTTMMMTIEFVFATHEERHAKCVAFFFLWLRSVADALGGDDAAAIRTTPYNLAHGAVRTAADDTALDISFRYGRVRDSGKAGGRHGYRCSGCRSRERGEAEDKSGGKSGSDRLHE
jgi:hypothetical protein